MMELKYDLYTLNNSQGTGENREYVASSNMSR